MLDRILETYRASTYDFRQHAYPQDPLSDRFEEWIAYYRLKWAIAKVLKPATILEIGVRYGYSARAFLDACPHARLVGIDADLPAYGGHPGAVDWAEQSLRNFDVLIVRENSQHLTRLPGHSYDLIHIDGQQDGDGTYHDLDLSIRQARHILVDGYYWTRENFLAVNEWIWLNKTAVDSVVIIPGYAGEFILQTKSDLTSAVEPNVASSLPLAKAYTADYYLNDCGGYAEWRRSKGKSVDPRLQAVADVGMAIGPPGRVADLGAGRGELTRLFAEQGAKVTAIDYSVNAVQLIEETLKDDEQTRQNVDIICDSVLSLSVYDKEYDLFVASDLVEHLVPDEVDALYKLVSQRIPLDKGALVIHTAPNLWNYRYEHPRQQKMARQAGFWLPRARRTWYERLMHINEQNPRVLKRQLSRYFPNVLVWFADGESMGGSLIRRFRIADLRRATSLFAIASHAPIDRDQIANVFCMLQLNADESDTIRLTIDRYPERISIGNEFTVPAVLYNPTDKRLASLKPNPFQLSYHWLDEQGNFIVYDGLRTELRPPLLAHQHATYAVRIKAPEKPGRYALRVRPVQEMAAWLEHANPGADVIILVEDADTSGSIHMTDAISLASTAQPAERSTERIGKNASRKP